LIILWLGVSPLFAVNLNTLIEKSPFLPKGYNDKKNDNQLGKQPIKNSTLEFKSMVKIGNEWQFSVHDKSANKYYWVTKSKKDPNAQLLDFNIESETITVNINGTQQTLTRSKPNYAAMTPPMPQSLRTPLALQIMHLFQHKQFKVQQMIPLLTENR
jgi:hypothetical protein